jgi:dTDP-4-dehydrorhamnose reductase
MTRVVVTGGNGQLGHHLTGAPGVVSLTRAELDITDTDQVRAVLAEHQPDVVINAAAYTAVDAAEEDEETAARVNETGPRLLAETLARQGGRLVHVSTDYVFDGTATVPYEPDDAVAPRTAYGRTKLAGERAARQAHDRVVVVRTAWVYGGPSPNFVDTMRRLERERDTVNVVADQTGSPTWANDLANALLELAAAPVDSGVYHYVNSGTASWYDLARETFRLVGADPERVRPVTTAEFPRPAPRPPWSVLSTQAWQSAGLTAPRPWQAALAEYLARG